MHVPGAIDEPGVRETRPATRIRQHWLSIAFVVLLVVPLYVLLVSVVARSGLLRFWGDPFTTEEFKALFAFLGVALGVVASTLAALLTKANNDRTLAQREESDRRAAAQKEESEQRIFVQTRESASRQRLDTAIQVLNLIKNDDQYAGKAVTGAAISTLVVLGYPVIAMRTLQAAMSERIVDSASATWVIDQVLSENLRPATGALGGAGSPVGRSEPLPSREEAAELLYEHVSDLTRDDDPGAFDWPSCASANWPVGLTQQCGWVLMAALLRLLVSRPASWWTSGENTWSWVLYTLYQVTEEPTTDPMLRGEAATYALMLCDALDGDAVNGIANEVIQIGNLRGILQERTEQDRIPSNPEIGRDVEAWVRSARHGA